MEDDGGGNPEVTLVVAHVSEEEVQFSHENELRAEDSMIVIGFNKLGFEGLGGFTGEGGEQVDDEVFETDESEESVDDSEETVEDFSFLGSLTPVEEIVVDEGEAEGDDEERDGQIEVVEVEVGVGLGQEVDIEDDNGR